MNQTYINPDALEEKIFDFPRAVVGLNETSNIAVLCIFPFPLLCIHL